MPARRALRSASLPRSRSRRSRVGAGGEPAPSRGGGRAPVGAAAAGAVAALALAAAAAPPAAAAVPLYFPGQVTVAVPMPATAVTTCDLEADGRPELVVGFANGTIGLMRGVGGGQFLLVGALELGGRVTGVSMLREEPGQPLEAVALTADPDRAVFVRTVAGSPPLMAFAQFDLDEDPGAIAAGPDGPDGALRCMVALPGADRWLLLGEDAPGEWSLLQEVPTGDRPVALARLDLDGDLACELITADNGFLSRGLSIFRADGAGRYELAEQLALVAAPTALSAFPLDPGGIPDLYVAHADSAVVTVLRPGAGRLLPAGRIPLTLPADGLHLGRFPNGETGLWSWSLGRGLIDYHRNAGAGWVFIESYFAGGPPISTELVDLNEDSYLDLLIANGATGNLGILFGNNRRGFRAYYAGALSAPPSDALVLDEDADGDLDYLVTCFGSRTLDILHGDGRGRWRTPHPPLLLEERPLGLAAVLADADTVPELAVTLPEIDRVQLLHRQAGGGYAAGPTVATGSFPTRVLTDDLDQDGAADLVVANLFSRDLTIAFGGGDGGFADVRTLTSYGGVEDVAILRLNADPFPDLVIADGVSQVYTLRTGADRTFSSPMFYNLANQPSLLATGDLDGDGDGDLVVARGGASALAVYENAGNGFLLWRLQSVVLEGRPSSVAVADVNLDGRQDIVTALRDRQQVVVLLNVGPWSLTPPIRYQSALLPRGLFIRDLNHDAVPDFVLMDQQLDLAVTMLNVEPNPVPIAPPALAVACAEDALAVSWRAPAAAPWRLEGATQAGWAVLADQDGARWGEMLPDGGAGGDAGRAAWRLSLSGDARAAAGLAWEAAAGWRFRLLAANEPPVAGAGGLGCAESRSQADGAPLALAAPRPNPANPGVRASLRLDRPGRVRAAVADLAGREVAILADGWLAAGEHVLSWDGRAAGRPAGAGVYLLTVTAEGQRVSRKVTLVK